MERAKEELDRILCDTGVPEIVSVSDQIVDLIEKIAMAALDAGRTEAQKLSQKQSKSS